MQRITNAKELGQAIRTRRKQLHYTQKQLSEFTGLSVSFLSDLENGKPTCVTEKTLFVANVLGIDLSFSIRGEAKS